MICIDNDIFNEERNFICRLDPRAKLLFLLLISLSILMISDYRIIITEIVMIDLLIIASKIIHFPLKINVIFILTMFILININKCNIPGLGLFIGVFGFTISKSIPIFLTFIWFYNTVKMDEVMVALEHMKIPNYIIIPVIVICRYFPTIPMEFRIIRESYKLRIASNGFFYKVKRPLLYVESVFIPLLIRALKVADELGASGMSRGLSMNCKRHVPLEVKFRCSDVIFSIFSVVFICILVSWQAKGGL